MPCSKVTERNSSGGDSSISQWTARPRSAEIQHYFDFDANCYWRETPINGNS
jgi:hypothetical protein